MLVTEVSHDGNYYVAHNKSYDQVSPVHLNRAAAVCGGSGGFCLIYLPFRALFQVPNAQHLEIAATGFYRPDATPVTYNVYALCRALYRILC